MDKKVNLRALRNLVVRFSIHGVLVTIYALSVLQFLVEPLRDLYRDNRTWYVLVALVLIVGQGVLLEEVTSFFVDRLRLTRFD